MAQVKPAMIRGKSRDAHVDRRSHCGVGAQDESLSDINHHHGSRPSSVRVGYEAGTVLRKGKIPDRPRRRLPEYAFPTAREIVQFDDAASGRGGEEIGLRREGDVCWRTSLLGMQHL